MSIIKKAVYVDGQWVVVGPPETFTIIDEYLYLEDLWIYLSDIERNYRLQVIEFQGMEQHLLLPYLRRLLYSYNPDQRPLTHRLIGKPSLGLSPPACPYSNGVLAALGFYKAAN